MTIAVLPEIEVRQPACLWVPPGRKGSFVDDVAEVAERIGRPLEPEQRIAVDALTAHDSRRRLLTIEAGVEMARQNGKTAAVGIPIAMWTALTDPDHIGWSAHMYETALKEFTALTDPESGLIPNIDWLRRRVRSISWQNGEEGITFTNGAQLDFRCRSGRRGRGLSGNTLFLDEWLFGTAAMVGASLPALATRSLHGNARAYYLSSAAKRESAHLRSLRARALRGDPSLVWVGWWAKGSWDNPGCETDGCTHFAGTPGCQLDNEERYAEANPMLGRRTSLAFLRGMRQTLAREPREFGREFLGWEEGGDDAIEADLLEGLADKDSAPLRSPVAFGVDVSPRQGSAAVIAVAPRADGLRHVEVLAFRPGSDWLLGWLDERAPAAGAQVYHLGGRTPVMSVLGEVERPWLHKVNEVQNAAAYGDTEDAVRHRRLRLAATEAGADPILTNAWRVARTKPAGDGTHVLSHNASAGDICPAQAMVMAMHGLNAAPPPVEVWGFMS